LLLNTTHLISLGVGDGEARRNENLIAIHATEQSADNVVAISASSQVVIKNAEKHHRRDYDVAIRLTGGKVERQVSARSDAGAAHLSSLLGDSRPK